MSAPQLPWLGLVSLAGPRFCWRHLKCFSAGEERKARPHSCVLSDMQQSEQSVCHDGPTDLTCPSHNLLSHRAVPVPSPEGLRAAVGLLPATTPPVHLPSSCSPGQGAWWWCCPQQATSGWVCYFRMGRPRRKEERRGGSPCSAGVPTFVGAPSFQT